MRNLRYIVILVIAAIVKVTAAHGAEPAPVATGHSHQAKVGVSPKMTAKAKLGLRHGRRLKLR